VVITYFHMNIMNNNMWGQRDLNLCRASMSEVCGNQAGFRTGDKPISFSLFLHCGFFDAFSMQNP